MKSYQLSDILLIILNTIVVVNKSNKNTFVLWPFQFQQEKKTNSGYKHFHFILDVSYVAAYIIRSDG